MMGCKHNKPYETVVRLVYNYSERERDRGRERIRNTEILFNKAIAPFEGVYKHDKPYKTIHTQ